MKIWKPQFQIILKKNNMRLAYNAIRMPDGTVLDSTHQHDYQTHTQEDGFFGFIDGGHSYSRYGGTDPSKIQNISLGFDAPHEQLREVFRWGTYGKSGKKNLHYIVLKYIIDEHLITLVDYTKNDEDVNQLFINEMIYRKTHEN